LKNCLSRTEQKSLRDYEGFKAICSYFDKVNIRLNEIREKAKNDQKRLIQTELASESKNKRKGGLI